MEENDDALASDALSSLEERIHRTVDLVSTLRSERDAALADTRKLRQGRVSPLTCATGDRTDKAKPNAAIVAPSRAIETGYESVCESPRPVCFL